MQSSFRSRHGFTLIELLVVIAIIAILAAILFPVFARARENARKISCISNLKQMALGVQMYSQDYDEKIPACIMDNAAVADGIVSWMQVISPYVKSSQVFVCPSWSGASGYSENDVNAPQRMTVASYTAVAHVASYQGLYQRSLSQFTKPSETIYGLDRKACDSQLSSSSYGCDKYYWGGVFSDDYYLHLYADALNGNLKEGAHMEGNNFFFMDGHAKWLNRVANSNFDVDPT